MVIGSNGDRLKSMVIGSNGDRLKSMVIGSNQFLFVGCCYSFGLEVFSVDRFDQPVKKNFPQNDSLMVGVRGVRVGTMIA
jgi:hypothetical protein